MEKYLDLKAQIVKSNYTKKDGTEAEGLTLQLVFMGRQFLVTPVNSKNYGMIVELAKNNPDCVITYAKKAK